MSFLVRLPRSLSAVNRGNQRYVARDVIGDVIRDVPRDLTRDVPGRRCQP